MNDLFNDLQQQIQGEIHFDPMHRRVYSVDASIYEIEPIGIVIPKHKADVATAVAIANKHQIPVIARGAATGIAGGCIGKALIIDTSKYLNHIKEINYEKEHVVCEPGVVQDKLNAALADQGYRLGPDTSTGNRATLGGMLANNSAGARSLRYGSMVDHVEAVELILADGETITLQALDEETWNQKRQQQNTEGKLYRELYRLQDVYRQDIETDFPNLPRRVSGYNLNTLLTTPWNPSQLIAGSEGTLGIVTEMRMRICKKPQHLGMCIIHFDSMQQAMQAVVPLLEHPLLSLEVIDHHILITGKSSPAMRNKLNWLIGSPQAILIAEFDGASIEETEKKLTQLQGFLQHAHIGTSQVILTDPIQMNYVWELRKAGLGLLLSKRSYSRAIAFIEDLSVPPKNLANFMTSLQDYLRSKGKEAGIYGHVGAGCMHIRPYIDLRQNDELRLMQTIMEDVSELVLKHGGALSGEHGDGLVRSWLNEKMFGSRLYQAFVELKTAFDPKNRMNPGKIVHGHRFLEDLRLNPEIQQANIPTFLDFSREGGIALAADLCNGNGACRKAEKLMCPSFQATGDEYDTTRARAQALRAVINGHRPIEDFTSPEMYDVLDLCLECKGCKTECPSHVDMAKMKAEFLYQYQQKNGTSVRSKLFANIGQFNRLGSSFARFSNWLGKTKLAKSILSWLGVSPERTLPPLALTRFSQWFKTYTPKVKNKKQVVLYNDTYNEFNHPEIGQAAIAVLEALGYHVIVPKWSCCGRPAISKGFLKQARAMAKGVINTLSPYAHNGIPIVGLEPSCLSAIKDDFRGLLGENQKNDDLELVIQHCTSFDEFLVAHLEDGKLPFPLKTPQECEVKLHGHCHQKALIGTQATLSVLQAISGFNVSEIPSGCCGLAGSFGYEKEHYEISMKIGALRLFPAIKELNASALIVANGVSCRSQISHGAGRQAKHLAEIIAERLRISE